MFWRRLKGTPNEIDAVGAKALREMDAEPLGTDIIHSVINPINKLTGAIHIYGGDFFAAERSEWDSMTLLEHRSDGERVRRVFEEANAVTKRANTFMRADVWPLSDTLEHLGRAARTSASGPKRTSRPRQGMSAFGGKADIAISVRHHDKQ